jgi:hypothetical protein
MVMRSTHSGCQLRGADSKGRTCVTLTYLRRCWCWGGGGGWVIQCDGVKALGLRLQEATAEVAGESLST